jgi:Zn-dependent protease
MALQGVFDSVSVSAVEDELRALDSPAKNTVRNVSIFLGSLVVFALLQAFSTTLTGLFILVVVLLIHELGHMLAMKLFRYHDVQMFFIPMFGAAVSGRETSPDGTRRAVVSLLGPVPGIVLGIVCVFLFHRTSHLYFKEAARTFLLVNTFNLLPLVPLDGGRYLESVLFSRTPALRALFDVVAGVALAALAVALKSILLGFIAMFVFRSVRMRYQSSRLASQIKAELNPAEAVASTRQDSGGQIPSAYIERLIPLLEGRIDEKQRTPEGIAREVRNIWNMVWFKPPSIAMAVCLMLLYVASFGTGLVATVGAEVSFKMAADRAAAATSNGPRGTRTN